MYGEPGTRSGDDLLFLRACKLAQDSLSDGSGGLYGQ